ERPCEFLADVSGPVDVRLNRDRGFGALDRLQHRGIEFVAVVQQLNLVAGEHRARRARNRVQKLVRLDREFVVESVHRWEFLGGHQIVHERDRSADGGPPPMIGDQRIETDDRPGPPGENQPATPRPARDRAFAVTFGDARLEPVDPLPRNPTPPATRTPRLPVRSGVHRTSAVEEWRLNSRAAWWRRSHDTSRGKFRSASARLRRDGESGRAATFSRSFRRPSPELRRDWNPFLLHHLDI